MCELIGPKKIVNWSRQWCLNLLWGGSFESGQLKGKLTEMVLWCCLAHLQININICMYRFICFMLKCAMFIYIYISICIERNIYIYIYLFIYLFMMCISIQFILRFVYIRSNYVIHWSEVPGTSHCRFYFPGWSRWCKHTFHWVWFTCYIPFNLPMKLAGSPLFLPIGTASRDGGSSIDIL